MTATFALHPKLAEDCIALGRFDLCRLLLMNDATYPWFILVPERPGVTELYQLDDDDQHQAMAEVSRLSRVVAEAFAADKINVAALGNMVPQLHIHVIARLRTDAAWPKPVWGIGAPMPYAPEDIDRVRAALLPRLGNLKAI